MNNQDQLSPRDYVAPRAEVVEQLRPLSLLTQLSTDGWIEDFEDVNDEF